MDTKSNKVNCFEIKICTKLKKIFSMEYLMEIDMQVDLPVAIQSLKAVKFIQPIIEAVCNSLEADATEVDVLLMPSIVPTLQLKNSDDVETKDESEKKIDGFVITDNGVGFTEENITSFDKYLSSYKKAIGCKGVGRLTWLKVFKRIFIESYTKNEKISFEFTSDFSKDKIKREKNKDNHPSGTKISFSVITDAYYTKEKDNRVRADAAFLGENIRSEILSKLFFMKKQKKDFLIKIREGNSEYILAPSSVPAFNEKQFQLSSKRHDFEESFKLYYAFEKSQKSTFKGFLCADNRAVQSFDFKVHVPQKEEVFMFLTSPYLDRHCNKERNDFDLSDEEDLNSPITLNSIFNSVKSEAKPILFERYPTLEEEEKGIVNKCLDDYPHLSKYIKDQENSFGSEADIIKNAEKSFKEDKKNTQSRFSEMLKKSEIDDAEYRKIVSEITDLSARELAEYFAFRQQIIQELKDCTQDENKLEKHMHTLFMPMREIVSRNDEESVPYSHNLWILDDKFMSCFYAASDKTIKDICKKAQKENIFRPKDRPDITLFFSHDNLAQKDAVVVEFKGNYADDSEKAKAIWEITENLGIVKTNFPEIETVWGYAITKIDEKLAFRLKTSDFRCLFSTEGACKIFYRYYNEISAHVYFLDSEAVALEAEKRNKLFLDIMRGKVKK